jgi:elongation factor Ts
VSTDAYSPSAQDVKALRERTGAGMMDCKKALTESAGDVEQAIEILRKKQGKRIEDRGERTASEGTIQTYIHSNAKVGVLVEVNCETDFVARNDDFVAFAKDIALHIAAANPLFVNEDEVDPEVRAREEKIFEEQAADKPENVRPRIVEGQIKKWLSEVVLLNQEHVNGDKYDGKTISQIQDDMRAKTGENLSIRRFARFAVGE